MSDGASSLAISNAPPINSNNELRSVWMDLLTRDSQLLDRFEAFLANVVEDLGKSHSDVEQIERRMKQWVWSYFNSLERMLSMLVYVFIIPVHCTYAMYIVQCTCIVFYLFLRVFIFNYMYYMYMHMYMYIISELLD